MNRIEIEKKVIQLLSESVEWVSIDEILNETDYLNVDIIDHFYFDSIDRTTCFSVLESNYSITIPSNVEEDLTTINKIVEYLNKTK